MVCSRVLVVFVLSVIVRINAEEVVYRGTGGDGSYNEVRQSQGVIPGGESKTITTFSTRVLGGDTPVSVANLGSRASAVPENRFLGDNFGLLSPARPSLSPQLNLGLLGGQSASSPFASGFPLSSQISQPSGSQFPGISQLQQWQQPQLPLQLPQLLQQSQLQLQQPQLQFQQPQLQFQQPQLQFQQPQSLLQQLQLPFQQQDQPYPLLGGANNNYYRSPSEDQFSIFNQQ